MPIKLMLIFLLILFGCATLPEGSSIKKIPANNQSEAKNLIFNHLQFLKTLFTQTKDPYYNVLKWTEECLAENVIGDIETDGTTTRSESILFMKNGEPGYCSKNLSTEKTVLLYHYCPGEKAVYELKLPFDEFESFDLSTICDY